MRAFAPAGIPAPICCASTARERLADSGWVSATRYSALGCCWALMLVMFAASVAHLYWMALLALIMLIEKTFPNGDRLVYPVGAIFALLALTTLVAPGALS